MKRIITRTILLIITLLLVSANQSHGEIPRILGIIRSDTTHTEMGCDVILPAGDQNGDGMADFWTTDLRRKAFLFHGGRDSLSSVPVIVIDSVVSQSANLGDLSGDGYLDYSFTGFRIGVARLDIFFGGPSMDDSLDMHFGENTGSYPESYQPLGSAVRGDFDADGYDELITESRDQEYSLSFRLHPAGDTLHDLVFRPTGFAYPSYTFGWGMAAGDFNGDGQIDLALSLNPAELCYCKGEVWFYEGGPDFDTIPEFRFTQPGPYQYCSESFGRHMINLGDVNGDSYDDLYAFQGNSCDPLSYIYFGGPDFDTIPDLIITEWPEIVNTAGDINGDGYNDFMGSFPLESSAGAFVYIWYGGPDLDSVSDIKIYARDLPEYTTRFGAAISGVGDVNGDGVNDFAAGAIDAYQRGEVFVFSGTGEPTDVPEVQDSLVPQETFLVPNYPNPFHSSTTIEFVLSKPSRVRLTVINILGQEVAHLVDRQMSVGRHYAVWWGVTDRGELVAPGVYFCRLKTADTDESRKMYIRR